jgi:hypothetical protein
MSIEIINKVPGMFVNRGKTLDRFGLDQTGKINYTLNQQGFRSNTEFNFIPDYAFFGCSLVLGIGTPIEETFASQFNNSQNYGVCGIYSNATIFEHIKQFIDSPLYHPNIRMAVFWTDRDAVLELLDSYYQSLINVPLVHFFCGEPLPYSNCYRMVANIDHDVSKTHIGPDTHRFIHKMLCSLFSRL